MASAVYDEHFGKPSGWAERSTGVAQRRFADDGETASLLGERAARAALARAGVAPESLGAIIGACGVMEQPIPSTAVLIHRRLGLQDTGIPAFDANATCLSFIAALRIAALEIAAGARGPVLIVSSDIASAALDPDDPETAPLFGDGAAAAVVGPGSGSMKACRFETYSAGAESSWLGAGGSRLPARNIDALMAESRFRMDGPLAYRVAATHIRPFVDGLLEDAGWRLDDVDVIVPHQASGPAMALMVRRLGFDPSRTMRIIRSCGNMVATSIPTALAVAHEEQRLAPGTRVLLLGTGAGVSLGGAAWEL